MMGLFLKQIVAIFWKDLLQETRQAHHLISLFLFGFLLMLLFSFALSVEPVVMKKMASGIFWMVILFSSLFFLDRSFQKETEDGQMQGLFLAGLAPKAFYLGKLLSHLVFVLFIQVFFLPLMAVLFDLSFSFSLFFVLFLGSLGIATLGTFYAGLTASFREGRLLFPLLLFPMLVPILLASVKVTELVLAHDLFGQQTAWLKLLIVFDIIFLFGSLIFSDALFDEVY